VIYCVVPRELEEDLYERLVAYYADNPGVTVIVNRRTGPDRRSRGAASDVDREQRLVRDRRRARGTGSFPSTDVIDP
jgi:hypothetical protein